MKINMITCKTALSKSNLPGLDYSLNPYRGCQHNCAYCYVPNILRIKRNDWGGFLEVKTNIPNVLSKELKKKKPGVVGISTVTDPYQPLEKKYKLTRYCLEQLLRYDFPVCIQTKSDLIFRDIDLITRFSKVEVMFSIGTLDDSERKILEPYSSPISKRLEAMKKIAGYNVKTSVFFGPIYPTIKKQDIPKIIDIFVEYGATEIMYDKLNLKPGIFENIKKIHPSILYLFEKKSYDELFSEIISICKNKNVKLLSAF